MAGDRKGGRLKQSQSSEGFFVDMSTAGGGGGGGKDKLAYFKDNIQSQDDQADDFDPSQYIYQREVDRMAMNAQPNLSPLMTGTPQGTYGNNVFSSNQMGFQHHAGEIPSQFMTGPRIHHAVTHALILLISF